MIPLVLSPKDAVRCCEMAAVDQAVSSSTGGTRHFCIHEGEPWLINDRGAGLKET